MSADQLNIDEQCVAIKQLHFWLSVRPATSTGSTIRPFFTQGLQSGTAPAATAKPTPAQKKPSKPVSSDDDDDFISTLSASDDDEDAAEAIARRKAMEKEEKEKAERAQKARELGNKAAKSTLILDVKPEDDSTDLDQLEKAIKETVTQEGLLWGACQRIPIAFGIKKLRMLAVVVDDLVSTDDIQERIEEIEGVQSTDIHAFNKI